MNTSLLESLSNAVGIGHLTQATDIVRKELSKYADVTDFGTLGLIAKIDNGKNKTLLLDAHIDEVGFIVTQVFDDGFLKVSNVGGNDGRILPATPVIVHGKKPISAVFSSTPPHLIKDEKEAVKNADEILLDTGLGKDVKEIVNLGDYVTYDKKATSMAGNCFVGKSMDDRSCVYCLIELASRLHNKELPVNVVFLISEQEELGLRGAKTGAFCVQCDEAIALDVSFGAAPDVPTDKSGKLGNGAMIGLSPVLDKRITDRLTALANKNNIPHQFEVMGGATGTDADTISISKDGVPCGLISVPLRNMHTPCEVINTLDLTSVCDLLEAYVLSGGAL